MSGIAPRTWIYEYREGEQSLALGVVVATSERLQLRVAAMRSAELAELDSKFRIATAGHLLVNWAYANAGQVTLPSIVQWPFYGQLVLREIEDGTGDVSHTYHRLLGPAGSDETLDIEFPRTYKYWP